jgi:beta-galactosidase beta subunit
MILWPGDAHMPGVEAGVPGPVRKVVVKIAF